MDKQDDGLLQAILDTPAYLTHAHAEIIAAAVRSFMGSDEVVERACRAAAGTESGGFIWPDDFSTNEVDADRRAMRAGIRTALGGDGE